MLIVLLEL